MDLEPFEKMGTNPLKNILAFYEPYFPPWFFLPPHSLRGGGGGGGAPSLEDGTRKEGEGERGRHLGSPSQPPGLRTYCALLDKYINRDANVCGALGCSSSLPPPPPLGEEEGFREIARHFYGAPDELPRFFSFYEPDLMKVCHLLLEVQARGYSPQREGRGRGPPFPFNFFCVIFALRGSVTVHPRAGKNAPIPSPPHSPSAQEEGERGGGGGGGLEEAKEVFLSCHRQLFRFFDPRPHLCLSGLAAVADEGRLREGGDVFLVIPQGQGDGVLYRALCPHHFFGGISRGAKGGGKGGGGGKFPLPLSSPTVLRPPPPKNYPKASPINPPLSSSSSSSSSFGSPEWMGLKKSGFCVSGSPPPREVGGKECLIREGILPLVIARLKKAKLMPSDFSLSSAPPPPEKSVRNPSDLVRGVSSSWESISPFWALQKILHQYGCTLLLVYHASTRLAHCRQQSTVENPSRQSFRSFLRLYPWSQLGEGESSQGKGVDLVLGWAYPRTFYSLRPRYERAFLETKGQFARLSTLPPRLSLSAGKIKRQAEMTIRQREKEKGGGGKEGEETTAAAAADHGEGGEGEILFRRLSCTCEPCQNGWKTFSRCFPPPRCQRLYKTEPDLFDLLRIVGFSEKSVWFSRILRCCDLSLASLDIEATTEPVGGEGEKEFTESPLPPLTGVRFDSQPRFKQNILLFAHFDIVGREREEKGGEDEGGDSADPSGDMEDQLAFEEAQGRLRFFRPTKEKSIVEVMSEYLHHVRQRRLLAAREKKNILRPLLTGLLRPLRRAHVRFGQVRLGLSRSQAKRSFFCTLLGKLERRIRLLIVTFVITTANGRGYDFPIMASALATALANCPRGGNLHLMREGNRVRHLGLKGERIYWRDAFELVPNVNLRTLAEMCQLKGLKKGHFPFRLLTSPAALDLPELPEDPRLWASEIGQGPSAEEISDCLRFYRERKFSRVEQYMRVYLALDTVILHAACLRLFRSFYSIIGSHPVECQKFTAASISNFAAQSSLMRSASLGMYSPQIPSLYSVLRVGLIGGLCQVARTVLNKESPPINAHLLARVREEGRPQRKEGEEAAPPVFDPPRPRPSSPPPPPPPSPLDRPKTPSGGTHDIMQTLLCRHPELKERLSPGGELLPAHDSDLQSFPLSHRGKEEEEEEEEEEKEEEEEARKEKEMRRAMKVLSARHFVEASWKALSEAYRTNSSLEKTLEEEKREEEKEEREGGGGGGEKEDGRWGLMLDAIGLYSTSREFFYW